MLKWFKRKRKLELEIDTDEAPDDENKLTWIRTYDFATVEGITDEQREALRATLEKFVTVSGYNIGMGTQELKPFFGDRAATVFRTELTRVDAESKEMQNREQGTRTQLRPPLHDDCRCWTVRGHLFETDTPIVIWLTCNDDLRCEDPYPAPWGGTVNGCKDLHGRVISEGPYLGMLEEEAEALDAASAE